MFTETHRRFTMNELQVTTRTTALTAQSLTPSLFEQFIKWIDRGEKTTRTYIINLKQFIAYMRYKGIEQPARADIIAYRDYLTHEHEAITLDGNVWRYRTDRNGQRVKLTCKPNTAAQYIRTVCQFFKWTAANNLYPDIAANIHAPKVKHNVHRKEALTAQEVYEIEQSIQRQAISYRQKAQAACKDRDGREQRCTEQSRRLYAMYMLTVTAGLRTVEISRANIKDLETKDGQTYLYIWGKGHTEPDTKKAIASQVATAIQEYLQSRTDNPTSQSPLFVATGNRSKGKRLAPTTISTMLKRAMQEAGYNSERLTAHSLRHTAGTSVQEITGNLYTTQQYMRHSNPATTEIYLHNDTTKQEAAIAQELYNYYHGQSTDTQSEITTIIHTMTPEQIKQLESIARALTCKR